MGKAYGEGGRYLKSLVEVLPDVDMVFHIACYVKFVNTWKMHACSHVFERTNKDTW